MEYIQFSIENTVKPALYNKSLYIKRRLISPINECAYNVNLYIMGNCS